MSRLPIALFILMLIPISTIAKDCKPLYPDADGFLIKDTNENVLVKKMRGGTVINDISGSSLLLNELTFGGVSKKVDRIVKFEGANAQTVIHNSIPIFYDIFMVSQLDPDDVYTLAKFESKEGARYAPLAHIEKRINTDTSGKLPTKIQLEFVETSSSCEFQGKTGSLYNASPQNPLEDGEYVFFFFANKQVRGYEFSVKK